jgi:hypothetical protein
MKNQNTQKELTINKEREKETNTKRKNKEKKTILNNSTTTRNLCLLL